MLYNPKSSNSEKGQVLEMVAIMFIAFFAFLYLGWWFIWFMAVVIFRLPGIPMPWPIGPWIGDTAVAAIVFLA